MKEEQLSPQQSLQLIRDMIDRTQKNFSDNRFYFLLWGWITFIACTGQFVLKNLWQYEKHYLVWLLLIPAVIMTVWKGRKEQKKTKVKTYIDESMKILWMGMGISFFVLSMILAKLGWGTSIFPFFIMLYGLGTFISGQILRFRPLVWGGILAWMLAIGAAYVYYDYQMLFGAAAILVSYIIPAYMLRNRNKTSIT
jgi:hypothetical protein